MSTDSTSIGQRFRKQLSDEETRSRLLLLPMFIFEGIFFVIPFVYLIRVSLYENTSGEAFVEGTWTFASYLEVLTSDYIYGITIFTFKYALIVTVITVVLATFYAYAIWRADRLVKTMLLLGMILALFTTLVVKLYAWVLLLSPLGPVNDLMIAANIINEPVRMISNFFGASIGQVYITFPYAVLPIYSVLSTMDWKIVEASRDLGAGRLRSFYEVVLPQAVPGIIVATVITFTWSVGSYTAPALLGSSTERTFAIEVYNLMLAQFNWSNAGALAMLTILIVVINLVVMFNLLNRWEGGLDNVQ